MGTSYHELLNYLVPPMPSTPFERTYTGLPGAPTYKETTTMKHTLTAAIALFALTAAAATPTTPQATPAQELQAINQLCDMARYADRMQADSLCTYFVGKFTAAVQAAVKPGEKPVNKP